MQESVIEDDGKNSQDFGECTVGGMRISRRPNRRQSNEKAPGPRNPMATAIMITKTGVSHESVKIGVAAGNQENAMATLPRPTRRLAMGVSKPIKSKAPIATSSNPPAHVLPVRPAASAR